MPSGSKSQSQQEIKAPLHKKGGVGVVVLHMQILYIPDFTISPAQRSLKRYKRSKARYEEEKITSFCVRGLLWLRPAR